LKDATRKPTSQQKALKKTAHISAPYGNRRGGGVEGRARAGGGTTATHAQNSALPVNAEFRELLNGFP